MTPAAPRSIDRQLRLIDSAATSGLSKIKAMAEARVMASATLPLALEAVEAAVDEMELTAERGRSLSAEVLREGVRSAEYRNYMRALRKRCEGMQEPLLANAVIEAEVKSQLLAQLHATEIRRSFLRLGGRPPGVRARFARWVKRMDDRIQDLDREMRAPKIEADRPVDELEAQRLRYRLSNGKAVLAWIGMLSLVGLVIWAPWHDPNTVKAAQDIELLRGKVIPAGTRGLRVDVPCLLIDKSTGVSVSFRLGDQDIPTCLRESMITR